MGARTFTTILCWQEGEEDREACVKVSYDYSAGYAGDRIDPPEDASVEITAIERTDPGEPIDFDRWQNDASLIEECFENEVDEREAAAEYRAEQRRDDLMMDWFA
jgi:hypothetical protein